MAIFKKRRKDDLEREAAGQRLAHAGRRADHYRKLVATPSVLAAAGLFTLSGIAGGFLATGQTAVNRAPAAPVQPVVAPVAAVVPEAPMPTTVLDMTGPDTDLALDTSDVLPPALETVLDLAEAGAEPAVPEEEEQIFTSLSIDAATGREERRANRPTLTEAQAEVCRENLAAAANRLSVRFSANSTDAAPEDLDAAFSFAEGVASCSGLRVLVRGHADATGDETQNLLLSWERAEAIIEAIGAAGHDTIIYEPVGYGSRQLLSDAPPEQAEALNRRVEFAVVPARQ